MKKIKLVVLAAALSATSMVWAQDGKAALIKQFLDYQKAGYEPMAREITQMYSEPVVAAGFDYLRSQVPADKREGAAKAAQAEVKKYFDDALPAVQDKTAQLAPATITPILEQEFTEDELKQVMAWINSPVSRKLAESSVKMRQALGTKVVAEVRPAMEPKVKQLDENLAKALGATPAAGSKAPAKAPAKK